MYFEIIGEIKDIETIAIGGRIRDIMRIMNNEKENQIFALCIENKDCEDLEIRKIYQVLPDEEAKKEEYIRVIDESGEDYHYSQSYFIVVRLPRKAQEALIAAR